MHLKGIWNNINNSLSKVPDESGSWEKLREETDFALSRPKKAEGILESQLESEREGEYYILKNPQKGTYLKLTDKDFFIWNLMDGTQTVRDLVVIYFSKYNSFAFARIGSLVNQLRKNYFLEDQPINIYSRLDRELNSKTIIHKADTFWQIFLNREFPIRNINKYISKIYKAAGWIFFTKAAKFLYMIIITLGAFLFVRQLRDSEYSILRIWESYSLGLLALLCMYLIIAIIHEAAHAFAARYYSRDIRKGGFMLYFGMPVFFVDTTDMWMEPRWRRIIVSWAGPYSQLITGGVCSIVVFMLPEMTINSILFKFAFISYLSVFINLNPLLELDGYFVLMDWLEIPLLRRKSLTFVQKELWPKVLRREKFSGDEKIFSVYGILAGIWSACAICFAIYLWERRIFGALAGALEKSLPHKLYLLAVVLVLGLPLLAVLIIKIGSSIYAAFVRVISSKFLSDNKNLIAMLVAISVALAAVSYYVPKSGLHGCMDILKLLILLCAVSFAIKNTDYYRDGYLEGTFQFLAIFVSLLFISELLEFIGLWIYESRRLLSARPINILVSILKIGAYVSLLLSTSALIRKNFRLCNRNEKIVVLAFMIMFSSLFLGTIRWALQSIFLKPDAFIAFNALFPVALAALSLALLGPAYFAYRQTEFRIAWLILAISLIEISIANTLRFFENSTNSELATAATAFQFLGYSLLASALFGHYVIYTRVSFAHVSATNKASLKYDDRLRLRSAFADICEAVFSQFISIYGERLAKHLQDKLNSRAEKAGWKLKIISDKLEDNIPDEFNIISRGEVYRGFLTRMFDLISNAAGQSFVEKAIQRSWDQLYWEEREVADGYLFSLLESGRKLTEEFRMTKKNLHNILQKMAIFSGLGQEEILLISSRLQIERFSKGADVVKQGEPGNKLYIIKSGEIEVAVYDNISDSERIVAHLSEGDYFGEVSLVGDGLRTATCRATTSLETWVLKKQDFNQLVKKHLDLPEKLDNAVSTMTMLKRMPIFREFEYRQINAISSMLKSEKIPPGTVVIKQGKPGDVFYIIKSGEVVVTANSESEEKTVGRLGEAEYFGEIALVSNQLRTATVTSVSETELLLLEKDNFDMLMEPVSSELEQAGSRRLLDTKRKLRENLKTGEPEVRN